MRKLVLFHKETGSDLHPFGGEISLAGFEGPSLTPDSDSPLWQEIGGKWVCLFKKGGLDLGSLSQVHSQGQSSLYILEVVLQQEKRWGCIF